MSSAPDYLRTCFVIMPFGKKRLTMLRRRMRRGYPDTVSKTIDFDWTYNNVFRPAIDSIELPEGGQLSALRADESFFSGIIGVEMFRYIEYSRFAVADITGLNPNVFFELGHRYRARESGTAVFRLPNAPIPFDINQIRAFAYEYQPEARAEESRVLIAKVLRESLNHNRVDSPIQEALDLQRVGGQETETWLVFAENAVRMQDWNAAVQYYERVARAQPANGLVRFRVGLCERQLGRWERAVDAFSAAVRVSPEFGEAYRELGIAENKLHSSGKRDVDDGLSSLRRAVELNGDDFDALSSLGGALRRAGRLGEALEYYKRARTVSHGHPYPLLNELKLEVVLNQRLNIFRERTFDLERAAAFRRGQVAQNPPIDSPWSFFDLAETHLYLGRSDRFEGTLKEGLTQPLTRSWQAMTFRETLEMLLGAVGDTDEEMVSTLHRGIAILKSAEAHLIS